MANIPIWPGSSSFHPGDTPFGFYDYNPDFQQDADKLARFCSLRLGYPIENVELQDINFYAAFEEAITVYINELYAHQQRENYLSLEGASYSYGETQVDLSTTLVTPNLGPVIRLAQQYGTEAGTGGNVNWYSGSVILTGSIQDYDLNEWASSVGLTGSDVEITRVFYQGRPASADYYYGGGVGLGGSWGTFFGGMGGVSGVGAGNTFFINPLSYNVAAIQEVEMGDTILYSAFSFELINNRLRIYPVPNIADTGRHFWFQYLLNSDRFCASVDNDPDKITNISQMPYRNTDYGTINSVGRSWIFEYTLALSKEMLGYIRGKYTSIPIPGADVTLNQADLLSSSTSDKNALIERLREYFESVSRQSLLERRNAESNAQMGELDKVPMTIFIG
jgi:hypothetical protein